MLKALTSRIFSPLFGLLLPSAILLAVGPAAAAETQPDKARAVAVTAAQVERMEIKIAQVKPASEKTVALLPGTVVPARNARVAAAAPFAGTVVQLHVIPGQMVAKGAPLATLSSRELLEAASAVAQAEAELQIAEATARRKRSLADKNIQNPALAEEAEAQVVKVKAVVEQHRRTLSIGGIKVGERGQYTIPAPADGRVVEADAMPGEKLDAMAAAAVIDTSNELWIEAQVPAELVNRIRPGDAISVANGPEGKVISIGTSLDKLTRSARLIASVPSDSGLLAGQMVTLTVQQNAQTGSLAVPASAVARLQDGHAVFVRSTDGFTLVPVHVSGRSTSDATITGDVANGALVAASGLPQLEQMLEAQ